MSLASRSARATSDVDNSIALTQQLSSTGKTLRTINAPHRLHHRYQSRVRLDVPPNCSISTARIPSGDATCDHDEPSSPSSLPAHLILDVSPRREIVQPQEPPRHDPRHGDVEEQSPVLWFGVGGRLGRAWDGVGVVHRRGGGVCSCHCGSQGGRIGVPVNCERIYSSLMRLRMRVSVEMDPRDAMGRRRGQPQLPHCASPPKASRSAAGNLARHVTSSPGFTARYG